MEILMAEGNFQIGAANFINDIEETKKQRTK